MFKKFQFVLFATTVMIVIALSAVSVNQVLAKSVSVELTDINYVYGKGVAFVFYVNGHFGQPNLDADFMIHGNVYHLDCFYNRDENKVVCSSAKIEDFAGETGTIYFNGQTFPVMIPWAHAPVPTAVPSVEPPIG